MIKEIYLRNFNFHGGITSFPFYAHLITRYSCGHITLKSFEVYSDGNISPLVCSPISLDIKTFRQFIANKYCAFPSSQKKYFDLHLMRDFATYCVNCDFFLLPYIENGEV